MAKNSELINLIKNQYQNPKCELNFNNNYQLIVAVILSAQCTDKRVNLVTPNLFKKYPDFVALANADILELQQIIKSCGFYNNKSKNLIAMAKDVVSKYNGVLPDDKSKLIALAGVGEKTANVVLSVGFGVPAIAVDTHVFRVSNRLGLANANKVSKTQKQLEKNICKQDWITLHYALVLHGRYVCKAINPKCTECSFSKNCKFALKNMKK